MQLHNVLLDITLHLVRKVVLESPHEAVLFEVAEAIEQEPNVKVQEHYLYLKIRRNIENVIELNRLGELIGHLEVEGAQSRHK